MQQEHQHQFILQSCNLLFSSRSLFTNEETICHYISLYQWCSCLLFFKLGFSSDSDIHCKLLLLYLVKEMPPLMAHPWGMVRVAFVSENFILAGMRLVPAHCKERTFLFDVFNSLVWNSLNLTPDLVKRLMNLKEESCLKFPDISWTWYFGALIFVSACFFQGCREGMATDII